MNAVFRFLIVFAVGVFGRTAFRWFMTGPPDAGAGGRGADVAAGGFVQTEIAPLIARVLGEQVSPAQASLLVALTMLYAIGVGFFARLTLGEIVFGARLNGVIALLGAWAAVGGYAAVAETGSPDQLSWLVGFAIFGSISALALAAAAKAFVAGEFDAVMTGGPTRTGAVLRKAKASTGLRAPRGPSADRIGGAISRSSRSG